jgi:hypothetical protein
METNFRVAHDEFLLRPDPDNSGIVTGRSGKAEGTHWKIHISKASFGLEGMGIENLVQISPSAHLERYNDC